MPRTLHTLALATGLAAFGSMAQAALIDFTDPTTYSVVGDTITGAGFDQAMAMGGDFNISEAGPGAIGPLAGTVDGLGIGDDEISFPGEAMSISFETAVTLTAIYLLDFFAGEQVFISNGTATTMFVASANDGIGFFTGSLGLTGTVFTFAAGEPDDNVTGVSDFALAGVEIAPIPLPAAAGLLLAGLAMGGFVARRRRS